MTTDPDRLRRSARLLAVQRLLTGNPGSTVAELEQAQGTASRRGRLTHDEIRIGLKVLERENEVVCRWSPRGAPDGQ